MQTFSILSSNRPKKTLKLVLIISAIFIFGLSSGAIAQSDPSTNVNTFVHIDTFVPKELPLELTNSAVFKTIDGNSVLKFYTVNSAVEKVSDLQFLILTVDKKGNVKSGQGWRFRKGLEALSTSEIEVELKHPITSGDKLILTSYEAVSDFTTYYVPPTTVLFEISQKGMIKKNKKFIRAVGAKLLQNNPCAAAQSAASVACACGIKSFSCNPQTGAYSFICFSQQENPSACPEGPPES